LPHFYFDTEGSGEDSRDERGIDLPDESSAANAAILALIDMIRDELPNGRSLDLMISVRDCDGQPVFRASMGYEALWGQGQQVAVRGRRRN